MYSDHSALTIFLAFANDEIDDGTSGMLSMSLSHLYHVPA